MFSFSAPYSQLWTINLSIENRALSTQSRSENRLSMQKCQLAQRVLDCESIIILYCVRLLEWVREYLATQWAAVMMMAGWQLRRRPPQPSHLPSAFSRAACQGTSSSAVIWPPTTLAGSRPSLIILSSTSVSVLFLPLSNLRRDFPLLPHSPTLRHRLNNSVSHPAMASYCHKKSNNP